MADASFSESVARFRLSIQLEATYRALQGNWGKQLAVWACTFFEILALPVICGIHLVTTPYITMATLLVMFLLSCGRARRARGSVLDPLKWPVHLLRPKDHSRFGLAEPQRASTVFSLTSLFLRLSFSAAFAYILMEFLLHFDPNGCTTEMWHGIDTSRYQSTIAQCQAETPSGSECQDFLGFDARCNDETKWAKKLRRQARNRVGLPCKSGTNASYDSGSIAKFVKWLESDWFDNEYCELSNGTQIECYSFTEPFALLWTERQLSLDRVCPSWPLESFNYTYYCYAHMLEAALCRDAARGTVMLEATSTSHLGGPCEPKDCVENLPSWLTKILPVEDQVWFCKCRSCQPWYRSNYCTIMAVNDAHRKRANLTHLDYDSLTSLDLYWNDPTYAIQLVVCFFMIFSPVASLLAFGMFALCFGNPVAVPPNLQLQQTVLEEEIIIAEELRTTGSVIQRTPFAVLAGSKIERHLNRVVMLIELAFYVADFVLDFEMLSLYFSHEHYWFAVAQALILSRSIVDMLLRPAIFRRCMVHEIIDSFKANLRTDVFLTMLQNEKTGEATLSFFLQTYAFFYMGTELLAYWTALFSLLLSARGIAQGCYIHFDLAVVPGRTHGIPWRNGEMAVVPVVPVDDKRADALAQGSMTLPDDCGINAREPASTTVSLPPGSTSFTVTVGSTSFPPDSPTHRPPMMDFTNESTPRVEEHANEHDSSPCAKGTVCALPCLGEDAQGAKEANNRDAPALIGKAENIVVPEEFFST